MQSTNTSSDGDELLSGLASPSALEAAAMEIDRQPLINQTQSKINSTSTSPPVYTKIGSAWRLSHTSSLGLDWALIEVNFVQLLEASKIFDKNIKDDNLRKRICGKSSPSRGLQLWVYLKCGRISEKPQFHVYRVAVGSTI